MLGHDEAGARSELVRIIRQVRRRWRLRLAARAGAILLAAGVAAVLVGSWALQHAAFSPGSITVFRVLAYLVLAGLAVWYGVVPQLRRPSDAQVALYLEEHEPSLNAAVVSAVELGDHPGGRADLSDALLRRLVRDALERAHAVDDGRRIERATLRRASGALVATAVIGLLVVLTGPGFFRSGAAALLQPWRQAEAATPYRILVTPGNATVPRGADVTVSAALSGFTSGQVSLVLRSKGGEGFDRVPMTVPEGGSQPEAVLFALDGATDYYVEAAGVRSPLFRIEVADLPYTRRLELEYHYPAYTGLAPRTVEDAGDVAALRGTRTRLRVWTTRPTPAGRIVLGDGRAFPLGAAPDGTLTGTLPVDRDGIYRIELRGPDGRPVVGSPQYTITVLDDRAPSVSFEKPGRDTRATPVEEVFLQPRAEDDYGIGRLELVYSVNGGEQKSVALYTGGSKPLRTVSAGHTLYLEELGLQPGDVISYYARALDNDAVGKRKAGTSDIYFVQIRPFRKEYRAAEQRGMPGGGGQEDEGSLSERQKQVIAATFNLLRDRPTLGTKEAGQHRTTIALAQGRVRAQVETLARRMKERGVVRMDSAFGEIAKLLPAAATSMKEAEDLLRGEKDRDALAPEQKALQQLQRAEAVYHDVQVSMGASNGGEGQSPEAEDLADLFDLEMDRLRDQYETVQRGQDERTSSELDQTLERLKELARREQQAAERQRRLARGQPGGGGGGAQSQKELADQLEQEAHKLERLARENPQRNANLEESARRLRDAADAIRRAAADPSGAGARSAGDRIDEARRLLQRERGDRLGQAADEARRKAEELAAEQHRIAGDVRGLNGRGAADAEQARRLAERKDRLAAGVRDLEGRLDRLAADAEARDTAAAEKLRDAANRIRERRTEDKIKLSRALVQRGGGGEYGERLEGDISADLDSLRTRVAEAAGAAARADAGARKAEQTLEHAQELAQGMASLGERLRQRAEGTAPEGERRLEPGRQGQPNGQSGQPAAGQDGARGQPGQAGGQAGTAQSGRGGQGRQGQAGGAAAGRDGRAGADSASGGFSPGGGGADGRPGGFAPGEIRQFQREARERVSDAEALRREMAAEGRDVAGLDRVIERMRRLGTDEPYRDPAALAQLRQGVVDGLERLEFGLRRDIQGEREHVMLSGGSEVPERFRKLVEEYFKALARSRER